MIFSHPSGAHPMEAFVLVMSGFFRIMLSQQNLVVQCGPEVPLMLTMCKDNMSQ